MTGRGFYLIVLANICVNVVLVGLLYRWRVARRQGAYHALRRQVRQLCQQVGKIETMREKRDEEEIFL